MAVNQEGSDASGSRSDKLYHSVVASAFLFSATAQSLLRAPQEIRVPHLLLTLLLLPVQKKSSAGGRVVSDMKTATSVAHTAESLGNTIQGVANAFLGL
jgi:hypothetical protein